VVAASDVVALGIESAAVDAGFTVSQRLRAGELSPSSYIDAPTVLLIAADAATALHLATTARGRSSDLRIVLVVPTPDQHILTEALRLGWTSVVALDSKDHELVASLRATATGLVFPGLAELAHGLGAAPLPAGLLADDVRVLELLASGATNTEIADALHLSEATAKRRVSRVLKKLGATNRAAAVNRAAKLGVLASGRHRP
jgi:DNA-binding NarL/FixJ family response regulator